MDIVFHSSISSVLIMIYSLTLLPGSCPGSEGLVVLLFFFSVWSEVVPKPFVLLRLLPLADESVCD